MPMPMPKSPDHFAYPKDPNNVLSQPSIPNNASQTINSFILQPLSLFLLRHLLLSSPFPSQLILSNLCLSRTSGAALGAHNVGYSEMQFRKEAMWTVQYGDMAFATIAAAFASVFEGAVIVCLSGYSEESLYQC